MKNAVTFFQKLKVSFLGICVFFTSCNGQVKTNLPKETVIEPKIITNGQSKMIRTQGIVSGNVGCELQDIAGNIWFSTTGEGVYRFDGKSFTNFTTKDGLNDNNVSAIIEDRAGNLLFGTKNGICKFDPSASLKAGGKPFSKYTENADLNKLSISSLLEDRDGNLWIGTMNSGVFRYNPTKSSGKSLTNFLNNDDYPFNLGTHHQSIIDILEDKKGNIWFSSWNGGGVWRYKPTASLNVGEKPFTNYLPSSDYYQQNEDGRSGNKKTIPIYLSNFTNSQPSDSISDDMIFSITEDKAGNIWFATRRHGACRYDPFRKSFTSFRENEGFVSRGIYAILEDKKGNIWLTTEENGVFCYDGKVFKNFTTKDGLINNSVFSILEDKSGNLWFGTRGFGLSRYDPSSGEKAFINFSE